MQLKHFILLFLILNSSYLLKAENGDSAKEVGAFTELISIYKYVDFNDSKMLESGYFYKAAP